MTTGVEPPAKRLASSKVTTPVLQALETTTGMCEISPPCGPRSGNAGVALVLVAPIALSVLQTRLGIARNSRLVWSVVIDESNPARSDLNAGAVEPLLLKAVMPERATVKNRWSAANAQPLISSRENSCCASFGAAVHSTMR